MTPFETALAIFVEGCQNIHTDHMAKHYPNLTPDQISLKLGKRYAKIIRSGSTANNPQSSVHCFVDMTNGDVLKAASWKAPAKHARGNIFDDRHGLGYMGEYGPAYLR